MREIYQNTVYVYHFPNNMEEKNDVLSYEGDDFNLAASLSVLPRAHIIRVRTEIEKLHRFPYKDLIPAKKTLQPLKPSLHDDTPLNELRPHCGNKTQYRLPVVSLSPRSFIILGLFPRKDAKFNKEIVIADERYRRIQSNPNQYVHRLDFEKLYFK
jgi:hypothetical protein